MLKCSSIFQRTAAIHLIICMIAIPYVFQYTHERIGLEISYGNFRWFNFNNIAHLDYFNPLIIAKYNKTASKESLSRVKIYKNYADDPNFSFQGLTIAYLTKSEINISILTDAYLSKHMSTSNGFITTSYVPRDDLIEPFPFKEQACIGHFDIGVYVIDWWGHFGHLIHDFLSALVFLPKELYEKEFAVMVPPPGRKVTEIWLTAFNFSKHMYLIDLNFETNVHEDKLYVIQSGQYAHGYTIIGIERVRDFLFDHFNLHNVVPTEYKIINRNIKRRKMHGINELLKELAKYNNLEQGKKWIVDKFNAYKLKDVMRVFSTIKVLITPQGSGVYNCIFMQPKTGILIFSSILIDGPNSQLAAAGDYFMIHVVHPNMKFHAKNVKCDAKTMARMADILIRSVNNGAFVHDPDVLEVFPIMEKYNEYEYTNTSPYLI